MPTLKINESETERVQELNFFIDGKKGENSNNSLVTINPVS